MATNEEPPLADRHGWFDGSLHAQGAGRASVPEQNAELRGPATVSLDREYRPVVGMEIKEASAGFDPLAACQRLPEGAAVGVAVAGGAYSASRALFSRLTVGGQENSARCLLSPQVLEFVASPETPRYWAMPLMNFLHHCLQRGEAFRQHPLRLDQEGRVVEFAWQGRPAFIEPLPDYDRRKALLESGERKRLLTAVMVGEVGSNPTDADGARDWFPFTLLRTLGFATGHEVAAPWIEFRDAEGGLVKRTYRGTGAPEFASGHRIIEEHAHPLGALFAAAESGQPLAVPVTQYHLGRLLVAAQSDPACQPDTFFVLLHQALRAGAGGQKLDDRLTHLFRAFERLCKEKGFRATRLRDALSAPDSAAVTGALDQAIRDIRSLASLAGGRGDASGQTALSRIAERVRTADLMDLNFGIAMCGLVRSFGFHDEAVMDAHLAAHPIAGMATWSELLNRYRNVLVHDGYFDTDDPAFSSKSLYSMNVHLLDLLARMLLTMAGYDGPYHPVPETWEGSQDYIGRITPGSPASDLGYD